MEQRIPSGQFDGAAFETPHLLKESVDRPLHPLMKGIGGVAPSAAKVARCGSNKDTGESGIARLPLDTFENLVNLHSSFETISSRRKKGETPSPRRSVWRRSFRRRCSRRRSEPGAGTMAVLRSGLYPRVSWRLSPRLRSIFSPLQTPPG